MGQVLLAQGGGDVGGDEGGTMAGELDATVEGDTVVTRPRPRSGVDDRSGVPGVGDVARELEETGAKFGVKLELVSATRRAPLMMAWNPDSFSAEMGRQRWSGDPSAFTRGWDGLSRNSTKSHDTNTCFACRESHVAKRPPGLATRTPRTQPRRTSALTHTSVPSRTHQGRATAPSTAATRFNRARERA